MKLLRESIGGYAQYTCCDERDYGPFLRSMSAGLQCYRYWK